MYTMWLECGVNNATKSGVRYLWMIETANTIERYRRSGKKPCVSARTFSCIPGTSIRKKWAIYLHSVYKVPKEEEAWIFVKTVK